MILLLPVATFVLGALVALRFMGPMTGVGGLYLAVACLAGMDTLFGGIRAGLEGKYFNDVFLTGFVSNVAIAFFLAWLGDQIRIDLYLVVALVMGNRIFTNLSLTRRILLTKWQDHRERERLQTLAQKQSATEGNA